MSFRPCIAKLPFGFWMRRKLPRASILGRVEQRAFAMLPPLPLELQETISSEVIRRLKNLHSDTKSAMEKRNADDLCLGLSSSRRIFFSLPKLAWQHVCDNHLPLSIPEMEEIVRVLDGRRRKGDAEVLGQLIRDAKAMYGIDPTSKMLSTGLSALTRSGQQLEAYDLLMLFVGYKTKPFRITSRHWLTVMRGLARIGDVARLKACLGFMKKALPFPGSPHYHSLLEGLYRQSLPPSLDEVHGVLDELQAFRIPFDDAVYDVLVRLEEKYGFNALPSEYKERCNNLQKPSEVQVRDWLKQLVALRKSAKVAFETKLTILRHEGFVPDECTFGKLVQLTSLSSPTELAYLQETLEVPANVIVWSLCLRNALERGGWRPAISVYKVAKAQGIKPDAAMIHPLLRAMCNKFTQEPPDAVLDQALDLYRDFNADANSTSRPGPDTAIYNTLLRALASSKNKRKYFPIALQLLEDMRSHGVYMDRMTATSIAVILVRLSTTYEEAAEAYKQVRRVNADGLDEKGFVAVLHAFCALELDADVDPYETSNLDSSEDGNGRADRQLPVPPAKLYFEVLEDMYANGLRKTAEVYTILLGRYATLATHARNVCNPDQRETIVRILRKLIKDTHRQISVEAGLVPDAPLLNQLMDTYNRVGLFRDVQQVWTMLNSTGLVSPASVSIFFDACGHHGQFEQADLVFRELKQRDFRLNRRNYNSWVECLCRLGRLDEAIKFVYSNMVNSDSPEGKPDSQTTQILLSFASAYGRENEVRTHLKRHFPNL